MFLLWVLLKENTLLACWGPHTESYQKGVSKEHQNKEYHIRGTL